MNHINKFDFNIPTLIVGMGGTGLSCARFLLKRDCPFAIADSRKVPPQLDEIKKEFPQIELLTGKFDVKDFSRFKQLIVSPGISVRNELFDSLQKQGCLIIGDIELFAQVVDKPVIAITGSNGKSTVTTLVEKLANAGGIKTIAGGNLGIPALDLLETESDLYVLELSSFQLETTYSLKTLSATVLNVSEDHMDRYIDLQDYRQVKETIYQHTDYAIVNRDEPHVVKEIFNSNRIFSFGSSEPEANEYGLIKKDKAYQLSKGHKKIISSNEIKLKGIYNYLNILAALALLEPLKLEKKLLINAIKDFRGLAHRCEWVETVSGVQYFNDSKGTNTGATIAAINGFYGESNDRNTVLIAGGVGKDADFCELGKVIKEKIKKTILMGVDSGLIKQSALRAGATNDDLYSVNSMQEAVNTASKLSKAGDIVLFSPACASFDMYKNYVERGDDFKAEVLALKNLQENKGIKNAS